MFWEFADFEWCDITNSIVYAEKEEKKIHRAVKCSCRISLNGFDAVLFLLK